MIVNYYETKLYIMMKKIILGFILFLIALILFTGYFFFNETKYFITKASVTQTSFSKDNSYLFVSPLRAKADGDENIRVNIFILNNQGLGVVGKAIALGRNDNLIVEAVQAITDQYGKAVFDVSSTKAGEYYIEVMIDGTTLPQKAHLSFY